MDLELSTPMSNIVFLFIGTGPHCCKKYSALPPSGPSMNNYRAKMSPNLSYSIISQSVGSGCIFFPSSLSKQYWLSSMWAVMKGHTKCKLSILDQFWRANMLWRPHNGRFHLIFYPGHIHTIRLISFIVWWIPNRPINLQRSKQKECLRKPNIGEAVGPSHSLKNCPHIIPMESRPSHHALRWRMGNLCRLNYTLFIAH